MCVSLMYILIVTRNWLCFLSPRVSTRPLVTTFRPEEPWTIPLRLVSQFVTWWDVSIALQKAVGALTTHDFDRGGITTTTLHAEESFRVLAYDNGIALLFYLLKRLNQFILRSYQTV